MPTLQKFDRARKIKSSKKKRWPRSAPRPSTPGRLALLEFKPNLRLESAKRAKMGQSWAKWGPMGPNGHLLKIANRLTNFVYDLFRKRWKSVNLLLRVLSNEALFVIRRHRIVSIAWPLQTNRQTNRIFGFGVVCMGKTCSRYACSQISDKFKHFLFGNLILKRK